MSAPAALKDVEMGTVKDTRSNAEINAISEHVLPIPELEKMYNTNKDTGLTAAEAKKRLDEDGPNLLTPPKRDPWWIKLLQQLVGGFSTLLWVGSILCFIVSAIRPDDIENLTLGIVLAVVVTLTGIFAFYQDMKAEKVLEGFLKMVPSICFILRDGKWTEQNAADIVKGDIIKVQNGFKVAADCVMITSQGVKVDNSQLTGESEAQKRSPDSSDEVAERSKNVSFFGTDCVAGEGVGLVVRTGDHTAIGNIAADTIGHKAPETLMKIEIENFVHVISYIACGIGVVFLIISLAMGYDAVDAIVFTIGIIVANVPEGLLATVTVALTITALHMADKNVLVKNVETVETLGAISVIASDKTGTLTCNRMTVRHAVYNQGGIKAVDHGREMSRPNIFLVLLVQLLEPLPLVKVLMRTSLLVFMLSTKPPERFSDMLLISLIFQRTFKPLSRSPDVVTTPNLRTPLMRMVTLLRTTSSLFFLVIPMEMLPSLPC